MFRGLGGYPYCRSCHVLPPAATAKQDDTNTRTQHMQLALVQRGHISAETKTLNRSFSPTGGCGKDTVCFIPNLCRTPIKITFTKLPMLRQNLRTVNPTNPKRQGFGGWGLGFKIKGSRCKSQVLDRMLKSLCITGVPGARSSIHLKLNIDVQSKTGSGFCSFPVM